MAGPREVLHVAGYNGQGQQQGASIKEGGEVAGRCWQGGNEEVPRFCPAPCIIPADWLQASGGRGKDEDEVFVRSQLSGRRCLCLWLEVGEAGGGAS